MLTDEDFSEAPAGFKLSKARRDELPEGQRTNARNILWHKAQGRCSLCAEPLPPDGSLVDVDHKVAKQEGEGGSSDLSNLYLAHASCNRSRKNLNFGLAKRIIPFDKWCTAQPRRSFADVVEKYVSNGGKRIEVEMRHGTAHLTFGTEKRSAPVYSDPATNTDYFFMNVPIEFIQNDDETQPRFIEHDHVRALAIDFSEKPVHEPSNCRLVSADHSLADLKQFDGQHKTTAQILLGRTEVPMKFYVNPDLAMMQNLVVQIQQGIRKRPLSTTDTLKKLDTVIQDKVAAYRQAHDGKSPSENELVTFQPLQDQAEFKKRLLANFEYAVLNDDDLEIRNYISTKNDRNAALTDRVLVGKIIRPLICQELQDSPLDNAIGRETERETIVKLLNRITANMLAETWAPKPRGVDEDLHTRRARAFFMQGAVGWWLKSILIPAFQVLFPKSRWKSLFIEPLTEAQQERLDGYIDIICGWDIWSTSDPDKLAALRSNTVANTEKAFPDHTNVSLLDEFSES